MEGSGWGWDHFTVRASGDDFRQNFEATAKNESAEGANSTSVGNTSVGQLYAIKTLDYENPAHRRGFRFMVEVTDRVSF